MTSVRTRKIDTGYPTRDDEQHERAKAAAGYERNVADGQYIAALDAFKIQVRELGTFDELSADQANYAATVVLDAATNLADTAQHLLRIRPGELASKQQCEQHVGGPR